jgi:hypothetical protein
MSEFVAWVQVPDRLAVPRIGPIDHFIGIVTREHSVEGVVQFFGDVVHPFRLTENYQGPPIMCGFLVDPTRDAEPAEVRNPEFEERAIPHFGEQSRENTAAVRAAFEERLTRIVAQFQGMANARLVEETVGGDTGAPCGSAIYGGTRESPGTENGGARFAGPTKSSLMSPATSLPRDIVFAILP